MTRSGKALQALGLLLAAVVLLRLASADSHIAWPGDSQILEIRLNRVYAGLVVGAALGLSGALLQCLLRNPLASPDILGLASGAGLGVMVSFYLGYLAGQGAVPLLGRTGPAVAGSLASLGVVYLLSQRRGAVEPVTLILVGVMVAIVAAAGMQLLQHLSPDRGFEARRWLMGALPDDLDPRTLGLCASIAAVCVVASAFLGPAMDAASLSDDEAMSVGVPLARLRAAMFVMAGVLAGASVVIAGPVGFVGLVCPHVVRLAAGPGHRALTIGSAMAGAAMVVGADAMVRLIHTEAGRLPIGILTSLVGGPVFIVLLRRELRRL